jgi:hypothetical protein
MGDEFEWQPARYKGPCPDENKNIYRRKTISKPKIGPKKRIGFLMRVRPVEPAHNVEIKCGGRLLQVHPDDVARALDLIPEEEYSVFVLCEHRVCTD